MQNQPASQVWTVLVRDGRVFRRYRPVMSPSESRESVDAGLLCGDNLDVYEVDPSVETPPEEGQPVDPTKAGWVSISNRTCRSDQSDES
jgi:hypothetical protein